jgi:hypothetical protein
VSTERSRDPSGMRAPGEDQSPGAPVEPAQPSKPGKGPTMPSLRTSTIRVTGADGVPWEGTGESFRRAVCDLVRRRAAGLSVADPQTGPGPTLPDGPGWRLTAKGEALVAALRRAAAQAEDAHESASGAARKSYP